LSTIKNSQVGGFFWASFAAAILRRAKRSDGSAKVNQAVTATIDSCLFIYLFTCCETNAFV